MVSGGAILKCSQLRDYYLFDVYQASRSEMKEKLGNKRVALIVDELSDNEGDVCFRYLGCFSNDLSPHYPVHDMTFNTTGEDDQDWTNK